MTGQWAAEDLYGLPGQHGPQWDGHAGTASGLFLLTQSSYRQFHPYLKGHYANTSQLLTTNAPAEQNSPSVRGLI